MKKVFLCLAVFAMSLTAIGQEKEEKVLRHKGFETNRFIDNWEITVLGGVQSFNAGQVFNGETADQISLFGNIGDRVMPAFQISLGKWITPSFGARLAYQGLGLNDGTDTNRFSNSTYHYLHADAMVNLTNWICGYKSDRLYNAVLIGGFGWATSQKQNLTDAQLEGSENSWNDEFAVTAGISNRFRLCDAWAIHVDLTGFLTKEGFLNVPTQGIYGFNYELMAGVSYKLPTERNFYAVDYTPYKNKIYSLEQDLASSRKDVEKGQSDNAELKDQLAKERKAKEQALAEAKRIKETFSLSNGQSLSIYFTIDCSKVTDRNMENIKFLAEAIKTSAKNRVFTITGYADEQTGTSEHNMELSKRRAEAVYNALIDLGVDSNKLKVEYKGDTEQPFTGRPYMNRVAVVR
ncbi:MAG: OmpA family protein [Bacteroidales bacterium]|nr:OmpA family protein [Bacteroidales bacterium]MEE1142902.1 OmpA family protein [Bacteroidales bacterium]